MSTLRFRAVSMPWATASEERGSARCAPEARWSHYAHRWGQPSCSKKKGMMKGVMKSGLQAVRASLPEFEGLRHHAEPAPERGQRNPALAELLLQTREFVLEQRARIRRKGQVIYAVQLRGARIGGQNIDDLPIIVLKELPNAHGHLDGM